MPTIKILTIGLLGLFILSSCKKNNDDPDETEHTPGSYTTLPVYATQEFTFVIKDNGELWARGKYYTPWTDNSSEVTTYVPVYPHKVGDNAKKAWTSTRNAYFLQNDGTLWSCGGNGYGVQYDHPPKRLDQNWRVTIGKSN